jgi:hypothetical protein
MTGLQQLQAPYVARSEIEAIHIGITANETDSLIEPIGRFSARARREIDGLRPSPLGFSECCLIQGFSDALSSSTLVDDYVFDPSSNSGRDTKDRQGEQPDYVIAELGRKHHRRV